MGNEIIKHKREELGLSQSALGKIIGISQQHIDRYEKGYPVPLDKILLFSEKLGISKWELLPENFRPQETGQIYRIGYVQAGKFNEACQLPENEWEAIPYPINNIYKKANIFALGVKGDSMNLVFPPERTTLICCPLEDWLEAVFLCLFTVFQNFFPCFSNTYTFYVFFTRFYTFFCVDTYSNYVQYRFIR